MFLVSSNHHLCLGLRLLPFVTATKQPDTKLCLNLSIQIQTKNNMHLNIPSLHATDISRLGWREHKTRGQEANNTAKV